MLLCHFALAARQWHTESALWRARCGYTQPQVYMLQGIPDIANLHLQPFDAIRCDVRFVNVQGL